MRYVLGLRPVCLIAAAAVLSCSQGEGEPSDSDLAGGADGQPAASVDVGAAAQPLSGAALGAKKINLNRVAPEHLRAAQQGLAMRLNRDGQGLAVQRGRDGSQRMSLEGRFQHVLVVNQDAEGKSHIVCADSAEGVAAALGH